MVKKKEPLRLKEDQLEVGLARYRKDKSRMSEEVMTYGPWFLLVVLALLALGPLGLMKGWFWGEADAPVVAARLITGTPMKVWVEGSTTQLRSVKVSVSNVGSVAARDVSVVVSLRGKNFNLSGSSIVESGRSEAFLGPVDIAVKPGDDLQVVASCSNCR